MTDPSSTNHSIRARRALRRRSRRLVAPLGPLLVGCVVFVAACSSAKDHSAAPSEPPSTRVTTASAPSTTLGTDGARIFQAKCAGCHGTTGEGNVGPALVAIADRMTPQEQFSIVANGRGTMLAFSPALSDAQIEAVVDYTRSRLP